jgi:hypothetical protein
MQIARRSSAIVAPFVFRNLPARKRPDREPQNPFAVALARAAQALKPVEPRVWQRHRVAALAVRASRSLRRGMEVELIYRSSTVKQ